MDAITALREWALDLLLWPALWLSVGLGSACGLLCYAWRRGGWSYLWRDLLAGVIGFGAGQGIAGLAGNERLLIGEVQVVPGVVGAALALGIMRLLRVAAKR